MTKYPWGAVVVDHMQTEIFLGHLHDLTHKYCVDTLLNASNGNATRNEVRDVVINNLVKHLREYYGVYEMGVKP